MPRLRGLPEATPARGDDQKHSRGCKRSTPDDPPGTAEIGLTQVRDGKPNAREGDEQERNLGQPYPRVVSEGEKDVHAPGILRTGIATRPCTSPPALAPPVPAPHTASWGKGMGTMTNGQKPKRSRLLRAGAVAVGLLLLPLSSLAQADSSNLLPNGSFQAGTSGWAPTGAAFTIASDGAGDGFAGKLTLNAGQTSYQLAASPRPVLNTDAGITYTANGVVRSDTPGMSVCLLLKEFTSTGTLVLSVNGCAPATSQWAALKQVTLTAQNDGDQVALFVRRPSPVLDGESFEADNLSLVASGDSTAPSTPTNVSASAVSSSEIDVTWSASSDPDFGGVAGYAIYRDGGGGPIGTTSGSTTSYADTSLAPGSTHTYTVAAFDAAGNYSPQSDPSNPATTPGPVLVGLWHLDELSGNTAFDSSGRGHDGAISGPVTLGVPGQVGTAYNFVPKSAVLVPDAPDLVPGTANITVSYWVNLTTPPARADYDIFVKGQSTSKSGGGEIKIEVQPGGQASCGFWGALGGKQLLAGPNVIDGNWHQVTCQRTGNQIVQTVDGVSASTTKATGAITVTDPVRLGSHENGGDWYKGLLDEVAYSIG